MAVDKRSRVQFRFDLDMGKIQDFLLAEQIETLKKGRLFADHVRNGLRLMLDLGSGNVDVLVELFPWVRERFNGVQGVPSKAVKNTDIAELKRMIEYQQQLMLGIAAQHAQPKTAGPKPLAAPLLSPPQFDDDDGISQIILKPHHGNDESGLNFLRSVQALIQ